MRRNSSAALVAVWLAGCGSSGGGAPVTRHVYNAATTAGDFMVIEVDRAARTITYEDHTTGSTGAASYQVALDGGFRIDDPDGRLLAAYEVPGVALVVQAERMGPGGDEPALIYGTAQARLAKADLAGRELNTLQLRSGEGGLELMHLGANAAADLSVAGYFPLGALTVGDGPILTSTIPGSSLTDDAALGAILVGGPERVAFGSPGGVFAAASPGAAMVGWPEADSKAFDPARAGRYKLVYSMRDAAWDAGVETGDVQAGTLDAVVSSEGRIQLFSPTGDALPEAALTPFEDSALHGAGPATKLAASCRGVFVLPYPGGDGMMFALFLDHALVLAGFQPESTAPGAPPHYQYIQALGATDPSFKPGLGLPACPAGDGVLTVSPLAAGDFVRLRPLGNLNPSGGHVFPTEHQYFDLNVAGGVSTQVPLVSPGHLFLVEATSSEHLSEVPVFTDWDLTLAACDGLSLKLGHVSSLDPDLAARIGSAAASCSQSEAGGKLFRKCSRRTLVELQPGDAVGTAGGNRGQLALDLGARDTRKPPLAFANPDAFASVAYSRCLLDYAAEPLRTTLRARIPRTAEPVCGTHAQDLPGTAQGNWRRAGFQTYPEDPHLALVHDSLDPTRIALSVGTSLAPVAPRVSSPAAAGSGHANRDPSQAVAGAVWCWDLGEGHRLVVDLQTATKLRAEAQAGACGAEPWTLGAGAVDFVR